MTATTLTAKHIDDSVHTCDCCGRQGLKCTVLMVDTDTGAELNFGRTCAARNSGKTSSQITKELRDQAHASCGLAGNELLRLRRTGTAITRAVVSAVCDQHHITGDNRALMLRNWS